MQIQLTQLESYLHKKALRYHSEGLKITNSMKNKKPLQEEVRGSLHAALHAEGSRYSGKDCRQSLKNEFPSFLFHKSN